jgi:hypothetical protein
VSTDQEWAELRGQLPDHATEVMSSHGCVPSIAQQSASHGAPLPAEDRGTDDNAKYC